MKLITDTSANAVMHDNLWIFDLDQTLIRTRSGRRFPANNTDYVFMRKPAVKDCDLMIYTNQGGIKSSKDMSEFCVKAHAIVEELRKYNPMANIYMVIADGHTRYRKPCSIGFWELGLKEYKKMIVVGDAAGRDGDHADSDYKFAANLDAYFMVPEAYDIFVDQKIDHTNPASIKKFIHWANKHIDEQQNASINYIDLESYVKSGYRTDDKRLDLNPSSVYLLCGRQGSGKSTFCQGYSSKEAIRLTYATKIKTMSALKTAMKSDSCLPIIVDGTFPDKDLRSAFIDLIKSHERTPIIVFFDTPKEICQHNRLYREFSLGLEHIPSIAVSIFDKRLSRPSTKNDSCEVIKLLFTLPDDMPQEYFLYYY